MRRALLLVAAFALSGCSQVDALAPVGGDNLSMVRFAANDLLVGAGIEVMTAPVCAEPAEVTSCHGTTMAGESITVESEGDHLTVTVGPRTLYDGSLESVINENAQPR